MEIEIRVPAPATPPQAPLLVEAAMLTGPEFVFLGIHCGSSVQLPSSHRFNACSAPNATRPVPFASASRTALARSSQCRNRSAAAITLTSGRPSSRRIASASLPVFPYARSSSNAAMYLAANLFPVTGSLFAMASLCALTHLANSSTSSSRFITMLRTDVALADRKPAAPRTIEIRRTSSRFFVDRS